MHTCNLVILLVVFWFQSVRGQNAEYDKNYSNRLTEHNNQESQQQNGVYLLAANKHAAASRYRRSSSDDSTETGPTDSGIVPEDTDDAKKPINFLRLYFCGPGYQNCMYDERLNNVEVQNGLLKQIPAMSQLTLPTNYLDWKSKSLSLPIDIKGTSSPLGRRDRAFSAEEPQFVLIRRDDANPRHLALLSGRDIMDDPFIPQRGRRQSKAQTYDDPFYPMRGRRANVKTWDDPFFPMRGRRADKNANAWDDPFVPMRGRKFDKDTNTWDDPFMPARGRRLIDEWKRAKAQPWDDPFIPMRGRRWPTKSIAYDDPFIPMRGRKEDYDDAFIPARGRRSAKQKGNGKERRKRNVLASTGTFNAIYTPSEEVIVKLNGTPDNKASMQLFRPEQKTKINHMIGTTSHSLNANHQQHQKKSYFSLDNFATNPDDGDNGLMNDYADYYVESPQMNKSRMSENKQRWMKSSRDLSQNRDAGNLARGSGTSLLF